MSRIAIVQMCASTEKSQNLSQILSCMEEAAANGATVCAFPEFMMFYTPSTQNAAELVVEAETLDGKFVTAIQRKAALLCMEVVGTIYEKDPLQDRVYDTAFMLDGTGVQSTYRKIHLYDALGFRESDKLQAGDRIAEPTETTAGKAGMMICYDLRFPEMARGLAEASAELVFAPSAWVMGEGKVEHWLVMNRARALENGIYMISPAHTGNIYCGHSLVVGPTGEVLLDMGVEEAVSYIDIDADQVGRTREALPLLQNRRLDVYPYIFRAPK